MKNIKIVLTGGPGGGKSTLIAELLKDPAWTGQLAALPEAITLMKQMGLLSDAPLFQRLMFHMQVALEDAVERAFGLDNPRMVLCHRGCLDPLAYWLDRGWPREAFFEYTETCPDRLYSRYDAVIQLVTSADGAEAHYSRWPDDPRIETAEDAVRIDHLLYQVWHDHPHYYRIDNAGRDWTAKSLAARTLLQDIFKKSILDRLDKGAGTHAPG